MKEGVDEYAGCCSMTCWRGVAEQIYTRTGVIDLGSEDGRIAETERVFSAYHEIWNLKTSDFAAN